MGRIGSVWEYISAGGKGVSRAYGLKNSLASMLGKGTIEGKGTLACPIH
jgi:hypothetical protein